MIYLAAAYGVIWLALFLFIFSVFQRQRKIDAELAVLEESLERITPEKQA